MTTSNSIMEQAMDSAAGLCAQGWVGGGGDYSVAVYYGDREALEERLGRKATDEDIFALEQLIRAHLDSEGPNDGTVAAAVRRLGLD